MVNPMGYLRSNYTRYKKHEANIPKRTTDYLLRIQVQFKTVLALIIVSVADGHGHERRLPPQ